MPSEAEMAQFRQDFQGLSTEIRAHIFSFIALSDKLVVVPKQILNFHGRPKLHFVSRFMLAFPGYFEEYVGVLEQHILKHKQVLQVVIVNYDFTNFRALLNHLEEFDEAHNSLRRYHFSTLQTTPLNPADLIGPYIHIVLRFGGGRPLPDFKLSDPDKVQPFLNRLTKIKRHPQHGANKYRPRRSHLRIFYQVKPTTGSAALSAYVRSLSFPDPSPYQGQMLFLMAALQGAFASVRDPNYLHNPDLPPNSFLATPGHLQRPKINYGSATDEEEDEYWGWLVQMQAAQAAQAAAVAQMAQHFPLAYGPLGAGVAGINAGMGQANQGGLLQFAPLPVQNQQGYGAAASAVADEDEEQDDEEQDDEEDDGGDEMVEHDGYGALPSSSNWQQHGYASPADSGSDGSAEIDRDVDDDEEEDADAQPDYLARFAALTTTQPQQQQGYGPPGAGAMTGNAAMVQGPQPADYGGFGAIPPAVNQHPPVYAPPTASRAYQDSETSDDEDDQTAAPWVPTSEQVRELEEYLRNGDSEDDSENESEEREEERGEEESGEEVEDEEMEEDE